MLRSVEIVAEVAGTAQGNVLHNLHWQQRLELDLDCFLCERTARSTVFAWGESAATCTAVGAGHEAAGDDDVAPTAHRTSARLERLQCDARAERRLLRAVVDCWWSPFHDEVTEADAAPLSEATPLRLALGYFCRRNHRSGVGIVSSGQATPWTLACEYCEAPMATLTTAPAVRLLG